MTKTKRKPLPEPTPERIKRARLNAGLTQVQAAELIYLTHAIRWSEYERGVHSMSLAAWELFLIKTGQRELPEAEPEAAAA